LCASESQRQLWLVTHFYPSLHPRPRLACFPACSARRGACRPPGPASPTRPTWRRRTSASCRQAASPCCCRHSRSACNVGDGWCVVHRPFRFCCAAANTLPLAAACRRVALTWRTSRPGAASSFGSLETPSAPPSTAPAPTPGGWVGASAESC
jgi:hypothetical protein